MITPIRHASTIPTGCRSAPAPRMNLNQTVAGHRGSRRQDRFRSRFISASLAKGQDFEFTDAGILPQFMPGPIGVEEVQPGTPADKAGLRAGDQIESVDGHPFHTVFHPAGLHAVGPGKAADARGHPQGRSAHAVRPIPPSSIPDWKLGFQAVRYAAAQRPAALRQSRGPVHGLLPSTIRPDIVEVLGRLLRARSRSRSCPVRSASPRMAGQAAETKGWSPEVRPRRRPSA